MNTEKQITSITEDAINIALKFIQDEIGITHGDFASVYFSGEEYSKLERILAEYIRAEMKGKKK